MKYLKQLENWLTEPDNQGWIVVAAVLIVLLASVILANAKTTGYATPDPDDWYETLRQPDQPAVSCCGAADAYYADDQEMAPDGSTIAIITDTRADDRKLPNGKEVHRTHVPVGTKVLIPPEKVRKHAVFNPTGHTIVFMDMGWVYCYEPQPLI